MVVVQRVLAVKYVRENEVYACANILLCTLSWGMHVCTRGCFPALQSLKEDTAPKNILQHRSQRLCHITVCPAETPNSAYAPMKRPAPLHDWEL